MSFENVLAESRARMSPPIRSFYEGADWPPEDVIDFINRVGSATIASVGPTGHPHAAFVIARFVAEAIHFTVTPQTILERNLSSETRIGFTVADRDHSVMGQGTASLAAVIDVAGTTPPELASVAPAGWIGSIWRIDAERVFAG